MKNPGGRGPTGILLKDELLKLPTRRDNIKYRPLLEEIRQQCAKNAARSLADILNVLPAPLPAHDAIVQRFTEIYGQSFAVYFRRFLIHKTGAK